MSVDMKAKLRGSNFEIGFGDNEYGTTSGQTHNYKTSQV